MKRIRVVVVAGEKIFCIPRASDLEMIIGDAAVLKNFYDKMPRTLGSLIQKDAEAAEEMPKYIAYLVQCWVKNETEVDDAFGHLKRRMSAHAGGMIREVRQLTKRIAEEIKIFIKQQKIKADAPPAEETLIYRHRLSPQRLVACY